MSYIGNTPGVSSQRVVLEEVVSGSPKSTFTPISGYTLGYVDVLVNGVEVDTADFTASDGVNVTLATAAAVGDTVKIKTWLPRGLSDGYLKSEADAKYVAKAGSTMTGDLVLDNGNADGAQLQLASSGYSNWNLDNYSGRLRAYYGATEYFTINASGNVGVGTNSPTYPLDIVGAQIRQSSSSSLGTRMTFVSTSTNGRTYQIGSNFVGGVGEFSIYDATASAERMRIDSSGNVGIGTGSPATGGYGRTLALTSAGTYNLFTMNATNGSDAKWVSGTTSLAAIAVDSTAGANPVMMFRMGSSETERMRIDSSGNLLVGTQSSISGNRHNFVGSTAGQLLFRHTAQPSGRHWYMGVESSNDVFILYSDLGTGGVYITRGATSWTGNSDERLKTDLTPIENAIEKVSQLRSVTGRFKTDEENVSRAFLIAQDVQAVLPEAVDVRDDEMGTLGVRYTDTIPLLVAAIKEQQAIIEQLRADVETLKGAQQ